MGLIEKNLKICFGLFILHFCWTWNFEIEIKIQKYTVTPPVFKNQIPCFYEYHILSGAFCCYFLFSWITYLLIKITWRLSLLMLYVYNAILYELSYAKPCLKVFVVAIPKEGFAAHFHAKRRMVLNSFFCYDTSFADFDSVGMVTTKTVRQSLVCRGPYAETSYTTLNYTHTS